MSNTVTVATVYLENQPTYTPYRNRNSRFREQLEKSPLLHSLSTASLIFLSGGMNLALGLGWNINTFVTTTIVFQYCWFVGVIIGAVLAAPLIPLIEKRFYMIFSCLLIIVGGIIFTSAPFNYDAIVAARSINGFAVGIATVAFLVHAGEIGTNSKRATCLSLEQYGITLGIFIQVIASSQWTISFPENRLHGILSMILGAAALGCSHSIIESPLYHISQGNEARALESMRRLEGNIAMNNNLRTRMEEQKLYVNASRNFTLKQHLLPLIKVLVYRSFVAFSFSLPLTRAVQTASFISVGAFNSWPIVVFAVLRVVGAFTTMWLLDTLGRKIISMFALVAMAGLTIGIGIIFHKAANIVVDYEMSIACSLSLLQQLFTGLFVPSTSVCLGEAFPLLLKPYLIALCVVVEQAIHIIVIYYFVSTTHSVSVYLITVGVVMLAWFLVFCITWPETRKTSLKEANERFTYVIYLKW